MHKIDHFSPSSLGIKCPRRITKRARKEAQEGYPSDILDAGIKLHRMVEEGLGSGDFSALDELLPHEVSKLKEISEEKIETEEWLEFFIDVDDRKEKILGRPDIIYPEKKQIWDTKTSWNMKVYPGYKKQLKIYSLGYHMNQGWEEIETYIYWIRYDRLELVNTFDVFDFTAIKKEVRKLIRNHRKILEENNQHPEPNPTDCGFCDWSSSCPKVDFREEWNNEELAAEVLKRYNAYKQLEGILKDRLKKSEGKVDISDEKYVGYYDYDSISADPKEILAKGEDLGLEQEEIFKLLRIDTRKLRKMAEDHPALANLVETEVKSRWSGMRGRNQ